MTEPGLPDGATLRTDPDHDDTELRGRTFAIPFETVWRAALEIADGGLRGWSRLGADDQAGLIQTRAESRLWARPAEITVRVTLDRNAQTRVDLASVPASGSGRWTARRRFRRFFEELDARVRADARNTLDPRSTRTGAPAVLVALCVATLAGACGGEEPAPPVGTGADSAVASVPEPPVPAEIFDRAFLFLSHRQDSLLGVAWAGGAASRPDSVVRSARGSLLLEGNWQGIHRQDIVTEGSPSPWRIVPDSVLRLTVDDVDGIQRIDFRSEPAAVSLIFGRLLNEWTTPRGGSFRLFEAEAVVGDREEPGRVVEVARSRDEARDVPAGDWLFVTSGDSLAVVMQSPDQGSETWQAWARRGLQTMGFPEVTVTWGAVRAFDRARRDVPVSWSISTPEGELNGLLELRSADIEAGTGEGPLLPVDGFFEVAGRLVLAGVEIPVRGLVRHNQR